MNLRSDKRYTVTREWCGYESPMWVVRFCDEWVSCHKYRDAALIRAAGESARRRGALIIEGV
jgi:hypothetical protein